MRIRVTPAAQEQFLEGFEYIRKDKPVAAQRFRYRVERVLRRVQEFPNSGRPVPEFPEFPHLEVIVSPYRFFYRVEKKTIWIVAVWHGAQEVNEPERSV